MKKFLIFALCLIIATFTNYAQPKNLKITAPKTGETFRVGRTVTIKWDTVDSEGNRTWGDTLEFMWSENQTGPWNLLAVEKNKKYIVDINSKNANAAAGSTVTVLPRKSTLYIKMQRRQNPSVFAIVGPISVFMPPPSTPDAYLQGDITNEVTLTSDKIWGLKKVVYVKNGGVLRIEPGTVIYGDPDDVSAICVNRGGKIYAKGTPDKPIIMTSGYAPGNRDRGDWGGLLIMGSATTNLGEAVVEGGISDDASKKENGWYGKWNGVNNDDDSSGVISYVRIEFAGIAESPDNELNGLTMGGVGRKTIIDHVQVSYGGDDSFEWFGGTVNAKNLIAYNSIDDDFDTDNGFVGKVQFGLVVRFPEIADQSNSEAFESDNDSKSSENTPFTAPVFSNITAIGPVQDTSWTPGTGTYHYNSKFLCAAQIRRNTRLSIFNSVFVGWPAGVELTNQNTVRAADADSIMVRFNNFYGIKNDKWFYFGSGTNHQGKIDNNWLKNPDYDNVFVNGPGNTGTLAYLTDAFTFTNDAFDPNPKNDAPYLSTARFSNQGVVPIDDPFFDRVTFRGAFGGQIIHRWDLPWSEYDPVNKVYSKTSVEEENSNKLQITVTPTPANELALVKYNLPQSGYITIKMFDATGSLNAAFITNEYLNEGFYEFRINTYQLAGGMYYLQFITEYGTFTKQIPIVK